MRRTSLPSNRAAARWRAVWARNFAGFTPKGLGLLLLLCALNALRRKVMDVSNEALDEWLLEFVQMLGLGLLVALPVALAVVATYNRVSERAWRRYPALVAAVLLSTLAGVTLWVAVESALIGPMWPVGANAVEKAVYFARFSWLRYAALGALFAAVYVYARNAEASTARVWQASLDRQRLEAQMDEARLQVLQAQIEPHFLFNTLATVRRLYHTTPASAVATLDNLMRYLSVALPQIRSNESTVGREATLAESYLAIQQLRMGRRLGFDVEIPPALRDMPMPSMMLLTLIENAIKHGLAPLPEGGFVRVEASSERGRLRVAVSDSGRGFAGTSGAGTGLANIRARLAALYGPAGRLDLRLNQPRGITATIEFPLAATVDAVAS